MLLITNRLMPSGLPDRVDALIVGLLVHSDKILLKSSHFLRKEMDIDKEQESLSEEAQSPAVKRQT